MTKYNTANINNKGNMLIKVDCMSPPAAAAGAVCAKAEEMNMETPVILGNEGLQPLENQAAQSNLALYAALSWSGSAARMPRKAGGLTPDPLCRVPF